MRHADLKIADLETEEQLERLRGILERMTGVEFVSADLEARVVEFDIYQDLDDLSLTDVQCRLLEEGFQAGEIVEGQTCTLRFRGR